jgi:DNA-binding MarR family transcriptional regulator
VQARLKIVDEIDPSAGEAAHGLRAAVGRLRRRLREVAGTADLTPSQTSVLSRLLHDGPAGASDLAAVEGVRPQSMAATLAALEERGMIERRPDPADGRRRLITPTTLAHDHVAGNREAKEAWLTRALQDRFSEAERQTILAALPLLERISE